MAGFFLVYLVLLPLVLEMVVKGAPQTVDRTVFVAICMVSLAEVGVALVVRSRHPLVGDEIALQQSDPSRAGKWLRIQIVSYAIAISVALYGVVLRILGVSLMKAAPFYALALLLLLVWWPRKSR